MASLQLRQILRSAEWYAIMRGQHLFERYGLMQFGTLFGHGAYLGPDFTAAGAAAFHELERHYADYFATPAQQRGLQRPAILDPVDIRGLTSFFAWSAWAAATPRPDAPYSYLWVEDFLELFTTIMVAYIFVLLGVVHIRTATRVVYLDVIIYSVGG